MSNYALSPEELQTLASYEQIAAERAKRKSDVQWWRVPFHYFIKLLPAGLILDIGCGNGKDALLFRQSHAHRYIGIDMSPAMMTLARTYAPQSTFIRMNMHAMAFKSASFDGFWAAASLLHIPKYTVSSVLAEIRRVMKPCAIGFIALREGDSEEIVIGNLHGDNRFYAFYRSEEFEHILTNNGFEVIMADRDMREYDPVNSHSAWLIFLVRTL